MNKLDIVCDDGEVMYLTDGKEYYALHYWYIPKEELREFADVEPEYSYLDEDGDVCHEWDDDRWEVDSEIIKDYIDDYIKNGYTIYESEDDVPGTIDGALFKVRENDNGWYETLEEYLKKNERKN
tara:strand:- start:1042 stop:1416 length:375 start_codon:yes stop_codon:yes gene_type:complete